MATLTSLEYHYGEWFKNLNFTQKKSAFKKLMRLHERSKYSGNRGKTVQIKIKFIHDYYPEIIV